MSQRSVAFVRRALRRRRLDWLLLAGCAKDAPQDTCSRRRPNAQKINNLQKPVFPMAGVVGVVVIVAVGDHAVWRYRDHGQAIPDQGHGKSIDRNRRDRPLGGHARRHRRADVQHDLRSRRDQGLLDDGQRHRPAVVVGVLVSGAGRDRRRRSSPPASMVIPGERVHPAADHQPRRHPLVLDPEAQRQARRRARPGPHAAPRGRPARRLLRPVHRVLRPVPRQHEDERDRADRGRLRHLGGAPDRRAAPMVAAEQPGGTGQQAFIAQCAPLPPGQRAGRRRRQPDRSPRPSQAGLRRGAEPDPPDEPDDVRRRDLRPAHRGAAGPTCWRPPPEEFGPMYLAGASPRSASTGSSSRSGSATHRP